MLEDNMVKVGKKAPNFFKKGSKVSSQKKVDCGAVLVHTWSETR
jgi:hypothetical protein